MTNQTLPIAIQTILNQYTEPDLVFSALLPELGDMLQCDRCFLYLRDPDTRLGKISHCWRRSPDIPDVTNSEWKPEPASLAQADPLFAAALRTEPSVYIEDIETANPEIVNREFEHQNFGHRALIHSHLCLDNQLWGILQPCVFGRKRIWSEYEHTAMTLLEREITPLAVAYIKAANVMFSRS